MTTTWACCGVDLTNLGLPKNGQEWLHPYTHCPYCGKPKPAPDEMTADERLALEIVNAYMNPPGTGDIPYTWNDLGEEEREDAMGMLAKARELLARSLPSLEDFAEVLRVDLLPAVELLPSDLHSVAADLLSLLRSGEAPKAEEPPASRAGVDGLARWSPVLVPDCGQPTVSMVRDERGRYVLASDATAALAYLGDEAEKLRAELTEKTECWQAQMARAYKAEDERDAATARAEQLTVQLAGCGVAALGGTSPAVTVKKGDYGWSCSYQDTLDLRRRYEEQAATIERLTAANAALAADAVRAMDERMGGPVGETPEKPAPDELLATIERLKGELEASDAALNLKASPPAAPEPPATCVGTGEARAGLQGLFGKYSVAKTDGSRMDPQADYFVLRLDTDPKARHAARAYARNIAEENPELAADLERRCNEHGLPTLAAAMERVSASAPARECPVCHCPWSKHYCNLSDPQPAAPPEAPATCPTPSAFCRCAVCTDRIAREQTTAHHGPDASAREPATTCPPIQPAWDDVRGDGMLGEGFAGEGLLRSLGDGPPDRQPAAPPAAEPTLARLREWFRKELGWLKPPDVDKAIAAARDDLAELRDAYELILADLRKRITALQAELARAQDLAGETRG